MTAKARAHVGWTHVTFVESDNKPGVEYEIEQRNDGARRCSCEGFRFIKGELGSPEKACKHMKAYFGQAEKTFATIKTNRAIVAGLKETFTFRRAITFGSLTSEKR